MKGKTAVGIVEVLEGHGFMEFADRRSWDPAFGERHEFHKQPLETAALIFNDGTRPDVAFLILHDMRLQSFFCPTAFRFKNLMTNNLDHGNKIEDRVGKGIRKRSRGETAFRCHMAGVRGSDHLSWKSQHIFSRSRR